jgi:hypothetical protein
MVRKGEAVFDQDMPDKALLMALSRYNHAANASPRSGGTERVAPLVWCMIVVAVVALATYFAMQI